MSQEMNMDFFFSFEQRLKKKIIFLNISIIIAFIRICIYITVHNYTSCYKCIPVSPESCIESS